MGRGQAMSEVQKAGSEGKSQMASQLQQWAVLGLGLGRAEQSRERSPSCLLGTGTSHPSPLLGLSEVGGRVIPCVQPELEDEVGWRRPSGQGPQCGSGNDWLGCLAAVPLSAFTCPLLLPLRLGWGGWVAAQCI